MSTKRTVVAHAIAAIAAPPSGSTAYSCVQNPGGWLTISKNGIKIPIRVWWNVGAAAATTDANAGSNDTVTIEDLDGSNPRVGEFQQLINSLK